MTPGVFDHQVFMMYGNPGKGVLHAFLTNVDNRDLVPDYTWDADENKEFIVPLDTNPPPNSGGNQDGWAMATWATEEQADAFVNDVKPAMPPGLANKVEVTGHTVVGRPDFDDLLLTHGFYRKDLE